MTIALFVDGPMVGQVGEYRGYRVEYLKPPPPMLEVDEWSPAFDVGYYYFHVWGYWGHEIVYLSLEPDNDELAFDLEARFRFIWRLMFTFIPVWNKIHEYRGLLR